MTSERLIGTSARDDVRIFTPSGPSLTRAILEEQGDWFEPEMPFARQLVQPGWTVVDVGASFGCYTVAFANAVGEQGHVHAVEPHPASVEALQRTIAGLVKPQVCQVHPCALAAASGDGWLARAQYPELGYLELDGSHDEQVPVSVSTLDALATGLSRVDMIKIDVEQGLLAVLQGAKSVLRTNSPVIQFALRERGEVNHRACDLLMRYGYHLYRLLPGPGVLVPIRIGESIDSFCLNLFAVKPEAESALGARGRLLLLEQLEHGQPPQLVVQELIAEQAAKPWIAPWKPEWRPNAMLPGWELHNRAVALATYALRPSTNMQQAAFSLLAALRLSRRALAQSANGSRLSTAARLAQAVGERSESVRYLSQLAPALQGMSDQAVVLQSFQEPFLLPGADWEGQAYPDQVSMLRCAIYEAFAYTGQFAAIFAAPALKPLYASILALPVCSPRSRAAMRVVEDLLTQARRPVVRL
jgi:protein O-GlcNAc transferase